MLGVRLLSHSYFKTKSRVVFANVLRTYVLLEWPVCSEHTYKHTCHVIINPPSSSVRLQNFQTSTRIIMNCNTKIDSKIMFVRSTDCSASILSDNVTVEVERHLLSWRYSLISLKQQDCNYLKVEIIPVLDHPLCKYGKKQLLQLSKIANNFSSLRVVTRNCQTVI